jgi:transposase InsO family protein
VTRSGAYRTWAANENAPDAGDLELMRRLDELFLAWPFLGSRRMAAMLSTPDAPVNRKRAQRLMRLMGIAALGPRPRTTKPALGHRIFPYLLRGLKIERPGQVWAADITYIAARQTGALPQIWCRLGIHERLAAVHRIGIAVSGGIRACSRIRRFQFQMVCRLQVDPMQMAGLS